jgi:hypothetical protein
MEGQTLAPRPSYQCLEFYKGIQWNHYRRNFISLKRDSDFFYQGNQRFIAGGFRQRISLPLPEYQLLRPGGVHANNKEQDGNQDKPELSDINKNAVYYREKEQIDHFNYGIKKEEGQARQKFGLIPFHCKDYGNERGNQLNNSIQYNAGCHKNRNHVNVNLSESMSVLMYLMTSLYFLKYIKYR